MTEIICIANQKGGVGKTTTAINLSAELADQGLRTLLVDCDPQSNATTGIGLDNMSFDKTLYHGLIGSARPDELITGTEIEELDVIPSNKDLTGFEVEMAGDPKRWQALKELLNSLRNSYDFIILDCPPSLGLLTVNALTAADSIIIPLQCEFYAFKGLVHLSKTIKLIKNKLNPDLVINGILLTMYDQRTNLSNMVAEKAKKHARQRVFNTIIPRTVRLGEAPIFGRPILHFDPTSLGAKSYHELAKEIMRG
jgi:chromosome partitioning protein